MDPTGEGFIYIRREGGRERGNSEQYVYNAPPLQASWFKHRYLDLSCWQNILLPFKERILFQNKTEYNFSCCKEIHVLRLTWAWILLNSFNSLGAILKMSQDKPMHIKQGMFVLCSISSVGISLSLKGQGTKR